MAMPTPAQAADRWVTGMSGARQAYVNGINAVTTSPMEQAAQAGQRWIDALTAAFQSGRWAAALRRVTLAQWKDRAVNIGASRLSSGAQAHRPKVEAAYARLFPMINSALQAVANMPQDTVEQRLDRARAYALNLHNSAHNPGQGGGQ